jgi:hypothetical protein
MTTWDPWSYREQSGMTAQGGVNLVSYDVEATDGRIGKVDEATNEVDPATSWSIRGRGSSARRCFCRPAPSIGSTARAGSFTSI